jgi:hypothetical protein
MPLAADQGQAASGGSSPQDVETNLNLKIELWKEPGRLSGKWELGDTLLEARESKESF